MKQYRIKIKAYKIEIRIVHARNEEEAKKIASERYNDGFTKIIGIERQTRKRKGVLK